MHYLHTHFFSDSLLPIRVAWLVNVSFNTSLDTLGNLCSLAYSQPCVFSGLNVPLL